jgi:hypothetical protein
VEGDLVGYARLGAAGQVVGPAAGQVQLPVDQRMPGRAGVGQEHPDLAVLDPPGGASVLASHPDRLGALLAEPGLIDHQHRSRIAEVLDHIAAQLVADRISIPAGLIQQPLHPVGHELTSMLSQLPAVLAVDLAE